MFAMGSSSVGHRGAFRSVLACTCLITALFAGALPQAAFAQTSAESPISMANSFPTYPPTPVVSSVSATAFSLVAASDTEYSIDNSTWTTASSFSGLSAKTTYSVWSRWTLTHVVCKEPAKLTTAASDPIVADAPALNMPQSTKASVLSSTAAASTPSATATSATATAATAASGAASEGTDASAIRQAAIPLLPVGIMGIVIAAFLVLLVSRKVKKGETR